MNRLSSLLAFSETAKRGSFTAAARELGTSPSTLAKSVARLEGSLGLRLFHRTTRHVSLTPDGERLFLRCQRVLAELEELQSDASGMRAAPSGTLRIDLPIYFGRRLVLPLLAQLVLEHPRLALDVRLSDAYVDLIRDGVDVAVRIGELADSTLVAKQFASQDMLLCAAPSYLARTGTPHQVEDLLTHTPIIFRMPTSGRNRPWQFTVQGKAVSLEPPARLLFTDGEAMVDAARLGLGITQVPDYMVAEEIEGGSLVEVLAVHRPRTLPIHAVIPANRMIPARVRAFLDILECFHSTGANRIAAGER
jgi:LysR family transcriptional regulator, regulator for bpeEF and oprC